MPSAWASGEARGEAMRMWVSTTFGGTRMNGAFDVLDTTVQKHGIVIYDWSPEAEKQAAKRQALERLLHSIKTGQPSEERR